MSTAIPYFHTNQLPRRSKMDLSNGSPGTCSQWSKKVWHMAWHWAIQKRAANLWATGEWHGETWHKPTLCYDLRIAIMMGRMFMIIFVREFVLVAWKTKTKPRWWHGCVCVAIISPKCAWRKYGEVMLKHIKLIQIVPQHQCLPPNASKKNHFTYSTFSGKVKHLYGTFTFFAPSSPKKNPPTTKAKTEQIGVQSSSCITSSKSTAGRPWGGLPRGVRSQVCLEAKRLHGWQIGMHLRKTHVKAAINSDSCNYIESLRVWIFVKCLHVPHVDFYNCWKFAISVLDYNQLRTLFERAGSEVNPNIRRSKTHTTLMFPLWTCIALFSANPTQDSSDGPSGKKYLKVQGPKIWMGEMLSLIMLVAIGPRHFAK